MNRSKKHKGRGKHSKKETIQVVKEPDLTELPELPHSGISSARSSRPPSAAVSPRSNLGSVHGTWERAEPTLSRDLTSTSTLNSTASLRKGQKLHSRRQSRNVHANPSSSTIAKAQRYLEPPAPPNFPSLVEANIFDSEPPHSTSPLPSVTLRTLPFCHLIVTSSLIGSKGKTR